LPPLNLLIAYPYMNETATALAVHLTQQTNARWLLDSGAFTAWKSGNPIKLDDYCAFLSSLPVKPWRYFSLDVIGDGAASLRNYDEMRARGFAPVPVFTRGESLDVLERYYETSDLVAIGGLVSRASDPKPYLKHLHKHIAGRQYHALGFSSLDWLKYLKPYSVDSSSWESARRYGDASVYMGRGKMLNMMHEGVMKRRGDEDIASRVRQLGFDYADLFSKDNWRGGTSVAAKVTTSSWMWLAMDVEKRLGTRLFLALAASFGGGTAAFMPECYARALTAAGYRVADDHPYRTFRRTA
jgi:hypothetical protein